MIDVLIVLQSHSKSSANSEARYCGADKLEISKRCFRSLINTIAYCQNKEPGVKYRLVVLDDRSDAEFLDVVRYHQTREKFSIELRALRSQGIMASIGEMYEIGKLEGKDLVYFVQDDYLHYETALWEMIDAYIQFKDLTKMEVCIYPYDDPFRYPDKMNPPRLALGSRRHWRTAYRTACGFMMHHSTIVNNWELFEGLSRQEYNNECEDRTINRLFINMKTLEPRDINHVLFTPIPSLALHMGDESTRDPYLNWRELWDKFADAERPSFVMPQGKIVLNLGAGQSDLLSTPCTDDLADYNEVRVDLSDKYSPDLLCDIQNLEQIPNDSVDLVYSCHSLEHIYFHKIPSTLAEWFRVIKPQGEVRIVVPNIKKPAQYILEGKPLDTIYDSSGGEVCAIDMLYGHRHHIPHNEFMSHKTGFSKESAERILSSLHYEKFAVAEFEFDLLIRIWK